MSALSLRPRVATSRRPRGLGATLVAVGVVALGWIAVATALAPTHLVPFPWTLVEQIVLDWSLLAANATTTLTTAALGFALGVGVVIPLAALCFLAPVSEPVVTRVAVVVHVIPFVAIAPILIVALPGDTSRVVIAALQVYFPVVVGLLLGLRSTDPLALDVVTASGGGNLARLRYLRAASAAPNLIAGLQIAVPAAVLGALVAEFFGADRGLGALIVSSQQSLMTTRTWAIALFIGVIAAIGYGVVSAIARVTVPWAGRGTTVSSSVAGAEALVLTRTQTLVAAAVSIAVLLGLWQSLRSVFGLDAYFTKTPGEILSFLVAGHPLTGAPPSAFAATFLRALGQTLVHAAVGFGAGTAVAVALAVVFVALPNVGRVVMPGAIVVRSVPLVALTPLLTLVFGRGLLGVTVLVTLVTFFPTLVTVMAGLRSTPQGAVDVVRVSGGTTASAAARVRLLYAIPSITASARIAIPSALAGATLAEWLATGDGVGHLLTQSSIGGDYFTLWAGGVLLAVVVLVAYGLMGLLDRAVARLLGAA